MVKRKKVLTLAQKQIQRKLSIDSDTDYGYRGFEGNEETIGSHVEDPPKIRLTCVITEHGGGGGVASFNRSRSTNVSMGGSQDEMGYIRVEQSEAVRGDVGNLRSEMNFFLNDGSGADDSAMVRAFAFECDRITKINPGIVNSLRNFIGNSGGSSSSRMTSPNGRYLLQLQDDGNYVIYDAIDQNHPVAIFDLWWLMAGLAVRGMIYPSAKRTSQLKLVNEMKTDRTMILAKPRKMMTKIAKRRSRNLK